MSHSLQVEALYGGFFREPFGDDSMSYVFIRNPQATLAGEGNLSGRHHYVVNRSPTAAATASTDFTIHGSLIFLLVRSGTSHYIVPKVPGPAGPSPNRFAVRGH